MYAVRKIRILVPMAHGLRANRFRTTAGAVLLFLFCLRLHGVTLWSDLGSTLIRESGPGVDILGGTIRCDDSSSNTLYFKFHVDPLSDVSTEEYSAGFQLFEGEAERLGIGNSLKAWAYSAFNTAQSGEFNRVFGDFDLRSARPESSAPGVFLPYELPRRGIESTIAFKVQFIPGKDDIVTVWLNPDLTSGATEQGQKAEVTTRFEANCSFDQIRLRHAGGGGGWIFSDMIIATTFDDLVRSGTRSGAAPTSHPYAIRAWQREQGLPQDAVHAICQTREGYIWLAQEDSISRFDGVRFVTFGIREGFQGGKPRCLFQDSSGTLWVGTEGGGLGSLREGRFKTITTAEGLPSNTITALSEDPGKRLWIGTPSGLTVLEEGRIKALPGGELRQNHIAFIYKDSHGIMWVGAAGTGIMRQLNDGFAHFSDPAVDELLKDPHCLLEDHVGRLWIGAGDDYVLCRELDQWRRYRIPRHLAIHHVDSLVESADNTIWAGSVSEGLFQFREGGLTPLNASHGLLDNFVESLLVDHEGNLWVGTSGGLSQIRPENFTVLSHPEGLGYGAVHGLAEVAPGIVWAGKPGDGLYMWNGRVFSRVTFTNLELPQIQVSGIIATSDGECFAAGNHGILRFTTPSVPDKPAAMELAGQPVLAVAKDSAGALWAGTRQGKLWNRRDGKWEEIPLPPPHHPITAIEVAPGGTVWVGTETAGLYCLSSTNQHVLTTRNGLLSDSIRALHVDAGGTLWIGTAGGGLSWLASPNQAPGQVHAPNTNEAVSCFTFTKREGLPDDTINQILEDDAGRLWFGTPGGIFSLPKKDLRDLAARKTSTLYPQTFGREEGLLSENCTGGFSPAGLRTEAGVLWFSTTKGVVLIDPRNAAPSAPPPAVIIERVLVEDTNMLPNGTSTETAFTEPALRVPAGKRRIEIQYTALSYTAPHKVRFRHKLEGLDKDWIEAGARRAAFYGHVPPGQYSFRVSACNAAGVWNPVGAGIQLRVLPYFWQTWWFISIAALAAILGVVTVVRTMEKRRTQRRFKQLENERVIERERARIAQDLHDDLGSSLTQITLLGDLLTQDKDNPAAVASHAGRISQSAAQTVRALEEIVWALRPGSDTIQSLFEYIAHFAVELFPRERIACRLDFPEEVPAYPLQPETRHNIFLIVKEALTNALKHSGATEVRIAAKIRDRLLTIEVGDNGKGFDPGICEPRHSRARNGLNNMRRRATDLGGTLEFETAPGKGTKIRFTMALVG